MVNLRRDHARHIARTASAQPGGYGNVLSIVKGAADAQPGLGLRHAPICNAEAGIASAGDPSVAAGAQQIRQLAQVSPSITFPRKLY